MTVERSQLTKTEELMCLLQLLYLPFALHVFPLFFLYPSNNVGTTAMQIKLLILQ